jgi:hypothetical protein
MKLNKSLIAFFLLLMATLALAFPGEFYSEAIDQWLGDSWYNETSIQPLDDYETYGYNFSLVGVASHVQVQIYDEDGSPEYNFHYYFVSSGSGTIELGDKENEHVCRIRVWGISKYAQSAGNWSVVKFCVE